jgi:hypothetical protein
MLLSAILIRRDVPDFAGLATTEFLEAVVELAIEFELEVVFPIVIFDITFLLKFLNQ